MVVTNNLEMVPGDVSLKELQHTELLTYFTIRSALCPQICPALAVALDLGWDSGLGSHGDDGVLIFGGLFEGVSVLPCRGAGYELRTGGRSVSGLFSSGYLVGLVNLRLIAFFLLLA